MFFNLHIRSSLAHISRQNRNYLFRKETQNPMFAFLIIWIHLKQKQKTDLISDVSLCLRKEKNNNWRTKMSRCLHSDRSVWVRATLWWQEDDEKGKGAKTALMGNQEFRKNPQTAFLKEKTRENIGMCTMISPFSTVFHFKEGGGEKS